MSEMPLLSPSGKGSLRLFFGLGLPDHERQSLFCESRRILSGERLVPPENYHVTLAFLGQVEAACLPELQRIFGRVADGAAETGSSAGSVVRLNQLAPFPRASSRLFAAWVEPASWLVSLWEQIWKWLEPAGFHRDYPRYQPHITVCRKTHQKVEPFTLNRTTRLASFCLYESLNEGQGVRYRPLLSRSLFQPDP